MQDFLDIAFSFPTVVFTISSIFLLGFWMLTTLIGAGADALEDFDFDLDADTDVDLEVDAGSAAGQGALRSALEFLGIGSMPLLLALNLESLLAWLTSMIVMTLARSLDGATALLVGLGVLIGSFFLGVVATRAIGRRFAHVFRPTHALRRREFVGSVCEITTTRVSAEFGQAEVRDPEGGSLIVQVRCAKANDLSAGDRVLIYDLDIERGVYHVSPDRSLAP